MTRSATDAITAEIIHNRMRQIAHEGGVVLQRCAVSPAVVEAKDCGFNLADRDGRTVIYSTWMPRHGTTLAYMLESCKQEFADDIRPGDMYLVNDPHAGALHALDLAVIAPVFFREELVAWIGNAIHHIDIGAMSTGRAPLATDRFQEGMIFRPIRLVEDGRIRSEIVNLFLDNVRVPVAQSLDLKAQVSANTATIEKLVLLVERYGLAAFQETCDEAIRMAEISARERIEALPDGVYEYEEHLDYDRTYVLRGQLEVRGDELRFDLSGTDEQSQTFINCATPCAVANMHNILACQLFPDLDVNWGTFAPVTIDIPSGTVFSCEPPAPCSGASTIAGWQAQKIALGLVSQAVLNSPEAHRAQAQWGSGLTDVHWTGRNTTGGPFVAAGDPTMQGGGARAHADGIEVSNIAGSTNTAIPSVESYEQKYPVLYLSRGVVPDSGGPGRYRGGLAGHWCRMLYGVDEVVDNSNYVGRDFGAHGFDGGQDGGTALLAVKRGSDVLEQMKTRVPSFSELAGAEEILDQRPRSLAEQIRSTDVLYVQGMGGGGLGPAGDRSTEAILSDVLDGFVSQSRVLDDYGPEHAKAIDDVLAPAGRSQ